jgi:hypothetical protein
MSSLPVAVAVAPHSQPEALTLFQRGKQLLRGKEYEAAREAFLAGTRVHNVGLRQQEELLDYWQLCNGLAGAEATDDWTTAVAVLPYRVPAAQAEGLSVRLRGGKVAAVEVRGLSVDVYRLGVGDEGGAAVWDKRGSVPWEVARGGVYDFAEDLVVGVSLAQPGALLWASLPAAQLSAEVLLPDRITCLKIVDDGQHVAACSADGTLGLWRLPDFAPVFAASLAGKLAGPPSALCMDLACLAPYRMVIVADDLGGLATVSLGSGQVSCGPPRPRNPDLAAVDDISAVATGKPFSATVAVRRSGPAAAGAVYELYRLDKRPETFPGASRAFEENLGALRVFPLLLCAELPFPAASTVAISQSLTVATFSDGLLTLLTGVDAAGVHVPMARVSLPELKANAFGISPRALAPDGQVKLAGVHKRVRSNGEHVAEIIIVTLKPRPIFKVRSVYML